MALAHIASYIDGMSDNLVLEHLRHIRSSIDGLRDEVREVKHRLTALEITVAGVKRDMAHLAEGMALMSSRMDRLEERVERIERRLDIVPAA